jgi:hypothetical protein
MLILFIIYMPKGILGRLLELGGNRQKVEAKAPAEQAASGG